MYPNKLPGTGITDYRHTGYEYENTVTHEEIVQSVKFDDYCLARHFLLQITIDPEHWKHVDTYLDEKTNEWRLQVGVTIKRTEMNEMWATFMDAMQIAKDEREANAYIHVSCSDFYCGFTLRVKKEF